MLSKNWLVEVQYIYREGNMCVDWLARLNINLPPNVRDVR